MLAWGTPSKVHAPIPSFARWILALTLLVPCVAPADSVYETTDQFLQRAFDGSPPAPRVIWLSGERKEQVRSMLGHDYPALRLRYWCDSSRSAWILEEIGKELPITVGVIISDQRIESLRVMVYRENRGGEVASSTFTDQFRGAGPGPVQGLDRHFDGITGATLSVKALKKLAKVALYLDGQSECTRGA